ncbi:MAG: M14 family zinc carboxypeptidase, partial [Lysobacterales bacterium]
MPLPIRSLLPLLLAALLPASVPAQTPAAAATDASAGLQVIQLQATDPAIREQIGQLVGHLHVDEETGSLRLEADALTRSRLAGLDIPWQVDVAATAELQAFVEAGRNGLHGIPGFECYRTVEETLQSMEQLAADHPHLVEIVTIGDSWQRVQNPDLGYPLQVLRLSNRNTRGPKPVLFAMSSVHAREYTPAELMTRFAEQLLAGYGTDADATWLLDYNEFHLLLQANPDGRKRAEQNVLWRKNTNTVVAPCASVNGSYHPGIDLNRNFPWGWANSEGNFGGRCSATYSGPTPGSEPETQAVTSYLATIFQDRRPGNPSDPSIPADADTQGMFLDMHSHSRLVLWPWGTSGVTGNNDAFITLGRRLAWFNDYTPQQSVHLYSTRGTTVDFAYGELGVPAFTFELGEAFFK